MANEPIQGVRIVQTDESVYNHPIYYFHYGDHRDADVAEGLRLAAIKKFAGRGVRFGCTQGTTDSHAHHSQQVPEDLRNEIEEWARSQTNRALEPRDDRRELDVRAGERVTTSEQTTANRTLDPRDVRGPFVGEPFEGETRRDVDPRDPRAGR